MKEYVGVTIAVAVILVALVLIVLALKPGIRDWMRRVLGVSSLYAVWTEGSGRVEVRIYERQTEAGLKYFAPHNDEQTSITAAKAVINQHGGWLVELLHSGKRNSKASSGTTAYEFDPNGMFSDDGAEQSLTDQGGHSSPPAVAAVRRLASLCLAALRITEPRLLIGAHNNTNSNPTDTTYSILSYLNDDMFKPVAELVNVDPSQDIDNFFFVTETSDYNYVVGKGYNAVLSKARPPQDNGSLGVYCAFHRIPYANSEAQHGKLAFQIKMYEELYHRPPPPVA